MSCWLQRVRKHGFRRTWKTPSRNGTTPSRKNEIRKLEELHQRKVSQMVKSADGSAGLLYRTTKPTAWRGDVQILKEEEDDAKLMNRCEEKR